ncbi:MAG: DoxX family protein [Cytophagales bacterium]|jgi:fatty acid desaturase|nr:DoxX family protein [Cytophagales bacterium]MCA6387207.1 DoxX family protein [Cytophagales bacterium]MCA6392947.1 DoxX family protein [Cytophagales bacterium]MCA6394602.1 DoxX family protein [Cytophagales bacterium]MCA6398273.1 DoxX family protein [Cytophagales bacterium]
MNYLVIAAQLLIAISIIYVWVFRFDNIIVEFKQYELSDLIRSAVGAAKIILATLIVAGIWYPGLVFIPSLLMGFLMLSARYFHFKVKNPLHKYIPSFFLLILCLFLAYISERPF